MDRLIKLAVILIPLLHHVTTVTWSWEVDPCLKLLMEM